MDKEKRVTPPRNNVDVVELSEQAYQIYRREIGAANAPSIDSNGPLERVAWVAVVKHILNAVE